MSATTRFGGTILAMLLLGGASRADNYYVVVFGAESKPQRPKFSHSFATFVRVPCAAGGESSTGMEWFTISWLPEKIELTPNRPFSEPGHNFDLHESISVAFAHCESISAFGPYEIKKELFCRALRHKHRLERGEIRYKAIDFTYNPNRVSNCIHALTVFNTENRRLRIGRTNFGDVASYYITDSYVDWIICPKQTHCWLVEALELDQYPIKWRTLEQGRPQPRE